MANDTILLVDDDRAVLACLREIFELEGYNIATASEGAEAIRWLESAATAPRLILLDLNMPGVTGWELLAWMRGGSAPPHVAKVPVVIMSFLVNGPGLGAAAAVSGADAALSKPVEIGHLLSVVEAVCDSHEGAQSE